MKRAFRQKTKAQRWEIDRNFALQRRSKIQASRDAENVQFYGRAQLGGMRSNKEPKDNVGRKVRRLEITGYVPAPPPNSNSRFDTNKIRSI